MINNNDLNVTIKSMSVGLSFHNFLKNLFQDWGYYSKESHRHIFCLTPLVPRCKNRNSLISFKLIFTGLIVREILDFDIHYCELLGLMG